MMKKDIIDSRKKIVKFCYKEWL